jgi:DNA polymerase-1
LNGRPQVPGNGPEKAALVLVGEAPGRREAAEGKPFVGRAGQLLDKALAEAGLRRAEIYISNTCICHPQDNKTPDAKAIKYCRPRLVEEVRSRCPRVVVLTGNVPIKAVFGKGKVTDLRGAAVWSDELQAYVIPTYHPAAVLRQPNLYPDLVRDLRYARYVLRGTVKPVEVDCDIQLFIADDPDSALALARRLVEVGEAAVDVECASDGSLLCVSFSWNPGTAAVLTAEALRTPVVVAAFDDAFKRIKLIGHNLKYDLKVLWQQGLWSARTGFDTMLAHYTLDERRGTHGLKQLARLYFNAPNYDKEIERYIKKDGLENCPKDLLYKYNGLDASFTYALYQTITKELGPNEWRVLNDLLLPASDVLAEMEYLGIMVDVPYLQKLDAELTAELLRLEKEMFAVAGREFNPNSPKQLAQLLYQTLGLPYPGRVSTDEDALKWLVSYHALPGLLLQYRAKRKFLATYVQALLEAKDENSRVHTTFNLHGTVTGRLSSSDPVNLQNIPREGEARNMFIATPGWTLVECDGSQMEVRVLAWYAKDERLLEALAAGGDIHTRTACLMFGLKPEEVTKEKRTAAKRLTFGLIYGMSAQSLAEDLGVSLAEAEELVVKFFEAFPRVKAWIAEIQGQVLKEEKLTTPFGRTRRFGLITNDNKGDVLRQSINTPIQSGASDLTLLALIRLWKRIKAGELGRTRLLLTVHDSILLETQEDPKEVGRVMREEMSKPVLEGIVLDAEVKTGRAWGSLEPLD